MRPEIGWIRDAAIEAGDRIAATGGQIAEQQDRFAALLASVDDGVGDAQSKLAELASMLVQVEREAQSLSAETGPGARRRAGAGQGSRRARRRARARSDRERSSRKAPASCPTETREALERVIRESIEDRLREVENVAARAVEFGARRVRSPDPADADARPERRRARAAYRTDATRTSARRTAKRSPGGSSLLIDSMHSAAIDVGKILSDEIDDKAWGSYLKGNRGVFTRRAVRLLGGSETRAITRPLRKRPRVPALGQPLHPRLRSDASASARRARRRDDRGDPDVVGHGQALRRAGAGDRQAALDAGGRSRGRRA